MEPIPGKLYRIVRKVFFYKNIVNRISLAQHYLTNGFVILVSFDLKGEYKFTYMLPDGDIQFHTMDNGNICFWDYFESVDG